MRLGSIQYINSLPVDLGFSSGAVPVSAEVVRGNPSELNQKILDGKIDLGPVSAFWYARHQSDLLVLPDISISSESGVQSVLLFSRFPVKDLAGKAIFVTGEGRTTPVLLEILCRKLYGFTPRLETVPFSRDQISSGMDAILLIGDEALVNRQKLEALGFGTTDLAEEWRRWTGLGFVFALWTVRREFAERHSGEAWEAYQAILASKKWGLAHPEEVVAQAHRRTGLPLPVLKSYFSCLSYGLPEPLLKGMDLYFRYARELGFLPEMKPVDFLDSPEKYRYNKALSQGEK